VRFLAIVVAAAGLVAPAHATATTHHHLTPTQRVERRVAAAHRAHHGYVHALRKANRLGPDRRIRPFHGCLPAVRRNSPFQAKVCRNTWRHRRHAARQLYHQRRLSHMGGSGAVAIGRQLAAARGWTGSQFQCLYSLWNRESGWRVDAYNPSSGATGIPQALPGSKMASAGADWRTNPATQIRWGLGYISGRYGTPCAAWGHSLSFGWY
jgi:hypothetical protein